MNGALDSSQPIAEPLRVPRRRVMALPRTPSRRLPLEWSIAIGLLLFAGFFFSGFFDTLIIQVLGRQEVDRNIRIMIAVVLAVFLAAMAAVAYASPVPKEYRRRKRPYFEWPLIAMLVLTPVWAVAGFINQWPLTYIVGDIFLLTVMPLTYFTLVRRPLLNYKLIFRWLYGMMLFMAVASTVLVVYHNMILRNKHKMSVDAALVPTYYIMLKTHPTPAEIVLVPVFVLAAIATSKRSTWAGLVIVFSLALLMRPGVRRPFRMALIAGLMIGIVMIVQERRPEWIDHSRALLSMRWDETRKDLSDPKGELSATGGGRMSEIVGVYDTYLSRKSPVDWLTGLGLGAIVQARGGRLRHHIHSTPATFLARTGVVGVVLWAVFVFQVLYYIGRHVMRRQDEWHRVQVLFWLGIWFSGMIFSMKSQAFWGSAVGGMQLAYIYHMIRGIESGTQTGPAPAAAATQRVVARPRFLMRRRGVGVPAG